MEVKGIFSNNVIQRMLADQPLFQMVKVSQTLMEEHITLKELPGQINSALATVEECIRPGMRIGITAGSRGIDKIDTVIAILVQYIKERGAIPFVVPCMGSHGVTASGQEKILEGLGITETSIGAAIISQDEVVELSPSENGRVAYMDRELFTCDGIVVLNRIKPHTAFHGPVESGLCKMMAVGIGKQRGAASCHYQGFKDMYYTIAKTANTVLASGKILFGFALLENAYGQLCHTEAIQTEQIIQREQELLVQAKKIAPSIPFEDLDLLIVDEMGKDISGSGMDTNVIGRYPIPGITGGPRITQLVALSLTGASEGSGHGMGFADFVSERLFSELDFEKTYPNGLTNLTCGPAKLPPVMPNDKTTIQAAVRCCKLDDVSRIRAVRIKNTHELQEFYVSPVLLEYSVKKLKILSDPLPLQFDRNGKLVD